MNKKSLIVFLFSMVGLFCMEIQAASRGTTIRPISLDQAIARERQQLLLYYLPWCPYSQRVLDYLKQIHRTVPMKNLQNNPKNKEDLRRIGGKTQVPCLIINGKAMYESAAIIQWLSQNKDLLEPT